MENFRKDILNELIPFFRNDNRYFLMVGDMGFGADENIKKEFPKRIVNFGIMEQGAVGIAAGMSAAGLIPIVYSIANFLVYRALEQIRNDVVLQKLNVKLIGTGANDYFKFLGRSHCCGNDDKKIMKLINMRVFDPYNTNKTFKSLVKDWLLDTKPGYIRV